MFRIQTYIAMGCSFDRIDEVLAPFAELNYIKHIKDATKYSIPFPNNYAEEKTKKDIYDAMQSLEYEINTLFTSNGQTPFTTLGFGLGTGKWEREIQKSILKVRYEGIGLEKRTSIFPKLLFSVKKGINLEPNNPNYDIKQLALKCAQKRIYPDILNYDKLVEITGSFKVAMGCRSFLDRWVNEQGEEVHSGRMNLGVVTINLPRIALESDGDIDNFWDIYEEKMKIVHDALQYRIKRCKEAVPANAPIMYQHGAFGMRLKRTDKVEKVFEKERATISIGYIGLYEVITTLFNDPDWENRPECKELSLKILEDMHLKAKKWAKEEGIHYSVYSTPSESLTDRFCRLDTAKFGSIEHITDKGYYTNSFHLDVRKDWSPFEKIDFEAPYPHFANGGFVNYVEAVIPEHNLKALEALWDYSYDKLGYFGVNTPIDKCYVCDFEGDFSPTDDGYQCPDCGNNSPDTCDVVKRQCGYLGQPQLRPNAKGRKKEIDARVKHFK